MQNNLHDLCECKPQGMSKVVVFIALFAQASTLLRQSPRKLFSVCHETPYEGPWKNSVRLYHPPVAGKLYKKVSKGGRRVAGCCATSLWQKVHNNQCFQSSTTTEIVFPVYMLLSSTLRPCMLDSCSLYVLLGKWLYTGRHGPDHASQSLLEKEWDVLCKLLKLILLCKKELESESLARSNTF